MFYNKMAYYQRDNVRYELSAISATAIKFALDYTKNGKLVHGNFIKPTASDVGEENIDKYKIKKSYGIWLTEPDSIPPSFSLYEFDRADMQTFIQGIMGGSREASVPWEMIVYDLVNKNGESVSIPGYKSPRTLYVDVKSSGDDEEKKDEDNENLYPLSTVDVPY